MKKSFILLPLAAAMQLAYATGVKPHVPDKPSSESSSVSTSESRSDSSAEAAANSVSSADSRATANASTGDSTSSATSGDSSVSNSVVFKQRRQAPGIYTAATNTTAACQGEWHLGASAGIGGISFGKSRTIRDCALAAAADAEEYRGNYEASRKLRCRISFYKEALGEDCEALLNTQDGSGRLVGETNGREQNFQARRTEEQRKADREKLLEEVSK